MKKKKKLFDRTTAWILIATSSGCMINHLWGTIDVISPIIITLCGLWLYNTDAKAR